LDLIFPFNGISKSFLETSQPARTAFAIKNMVPVDIVEGRIRGGQRAGMRVLFADSGLSPIQNIGVARYVQKVETVSSGSELVDYLVNKPYSYLLFKNDIDISFSLSRSISDNFYGVIDGNGFKITGLEINEIPYSGEYDNIGLIGVLGYGSLVKNLTIENCVIGGKKCVGALCGTNLGSILNCNVSGSVYSSGIDCGGIAGRNRGYIKSCLSSATVEGTTNTGGIAGYNRGKNWDKARIISCVSAGNITGGINTGGLCGAQQYDAKILGSEASGAVSGSSQVGGLCGRDYSGAGLLFSFASGSVLGTGSFVGGLIGYSTASLNVIHKCYATGNVEGSSFAGGLAGGSYAEISKCYAGGNAVGNHHVSAIVGGLGSTGFMKQCRGSGDVQGNYSVGGICGASECDIFDCYADGAVVGVEIDGVMPYQISPMIGHVARNTLNRCHAVGAVSIVDEAGDPVSIELAGGITGKIEPGRDIEVNDCYWDKTSTGLDVGCGNVENVGTGLTDTEMAEAANFNFDFYDRWYMDTQYPRLRYEQ
jgi:hypothetical protein